MSQGPYFLGCISGTSVDGLDIALLQNAGQQPQICASYTTPLPEQLRHTLLQLGQPDGDPSHDLIDQLGYADALLGEFIGTAIVDFMQAQGLSRSDVQAIGSHGQTVRHRPPPQTEGRSSFTLQIGDPARIAERTGITTVADFRRRDLAAGGQGAPLVPPFHQALFQHLGQQVVVLNIGGIGNVSLLHQDRPARGFDTGPGNCLMDSWCQAHRQQPYDANGAWAAAGQVDQRMLAALLADAYLALPAPKSTGREYFNLPWLQQTYPTTVKAVDVQATLAEFTAATISAAIAQYSPDLDLIAVCGGGRLNQHLMARLAQMNTCTVAPVEQFGVDGDGIEAGAFAWLAHRTLTGQAGNEPEVTGAAGYRILGSIHPA